MVTPAMQLASKIPDLNVQLWASAILKVNIPLGCIDISKLWLRIRSQIRMDPH
jgi:hypothetical protein